MDIKEKKHCNSGKYWVAGGFIAAGILMLCKNLGYIEPDIFHLIVSWKTFLIFLGIYLLVHKQFLGSFILIATGAYFLITQTGIIYPGISAFYWPVILILIGVIFLVGKGTGKQHFHKNKNIEVKEYTSDDGYFYIENSFGGVQQVIMDEEIKGGEIKSSFGGVVVDLRRTSIPEGTTYIDINLRFGGAEIYLPPTWNVKSEVRPFMGAFEDSRFSTLATDSDRVLVIRGEISVGGIEIKS